MDLALRLPWPVGLASAVFAYFCLHSIVAYFAATEAPSSAAELGTVVVHQLFHTIASILQYLIPLALVIGSIGSLLRSLTSRSLFHRVRREPEVQIASLGWQQFESLIAEGFRRRGFQVTPRGGPGGDGGIDLVLTRERERFLVQCKQWRARSVGVAIVRELYGVMAAERATGGFVVTSGNFTKESIDFASGRNIELLDGEKVDELIRDGKPRPADKIIASPAGPPACPRCLSPMVERVAKRGRHAGKRLWGCQHFPKCDGFIPID
jgi:restriction system protein